MPFKVADQRAVAVIAPPCPVIDADNRGRRKASWSPPPNHVQQRIVAHRDVESAGYRSSRPPAKRNRETVHDIIEPVRQRQTDAEPLIAITKPSPSLVALSTTNPRNKLRNRQIRPSP